MVSSKCSVSCIHYRWSLLQVVTSIGILHISGSMVMGGRSWANGASEFAGARDKQAAKRAQ